MEISTKPSVRYANTICDICNKNFSRKCYYKHEKRTFIYLKTLIYVNVKYPKNFTKIILVLKQIIHFFCVYNNLWDIGKMKKAKISFRKQISR